MDAIRLGKPWLAFDLPAGGKRLLQKADGYVATIKSGQVTFRGGEGQGTYPGTVIRGPQRVEMALAAESGSGRQQISRTRRLTQDQRKAPPHIGRASCGERWCQYE